MSYIINPKTKRLVKADGKIGKHLIQSHGFDKLEFVNEPLAKKTMKPKQRRQNMTRAQPIDKEDTVDKFVFHSRSSNAKPGKGVHEHVSDPAMYHKLENMPHNWRQVLSNFHMAPFVYKGHTYNTIEHVFQAAKIAIADPAKAYLFTVDSGDKIGLGDGKMAQSKRKLVHLSPEQLVEWAQKSDRVMAKASIKKYEASKLARRVLKATKNAELWHLMKQRGKQSLLIRFKHLEKIRRKLQDSSS